MVSNNIDVQIACHGAGLPNEKEVVRWVRAARGPSAAAVCVRFVDAAEGQALNAQWRGRDVATNVLSFPLQVDDMVVSDVDGDGDASGGLPAELQLLGDVVVCAPVVEREAQEQGKQVSAHYAHMVIHGVLHLRGYDHQDDVEARVMEGLEVDLLATLGYANPYVLQDAAQGCRNDG